MLQESRIISLCNYTDEKASYYRKKYDRARKSQSIDLNFKKYKLYKSFSRRSFDLLMSIRCGYNLFGRPSKYILMTSQQYLKSEKERIEKGRHRFLNLHTYGTWFYQTGLHCDYGTFTCEICGSKFYHSPSRIRKAAKVIYNCACGHCTNEIINADYGKQPYF